MTSAQVPENQTVYRFGDCELDTGFRELRRRGVVVEVQRKVFDLLIFLAQNRDRAVDKDEIQQAVWPGVIVTETALTRAIMKARRAVGDDADQQAVIRTVHGHGYRFVAEVGQGGERADQGERSEPAPATGTLDEAPGAGDGGQAAGGRGRAAAVVAGVLLLALAAGIAGWLSREPARADAEFRVAVLPVEDQTGDPELAWARLGLMGLITQMLRSMGVATVPARDVLALAEMDEPIPDLEERLRKVYGTTHVAAARMERGAGLYRLSYAVTDADGRVRRRTLVGNDAARLGRDLGRDLVVDLVGRGLGRGAPSRVSADPFVNEAYARGLSLQLEGRAAEAQPLFRLAMEQAPGAFWPRYEFAIAERNLGRHASAKPLLEQLVAQAATADDALAEASALNALGILLWREGDPGSAERTWSRGLEVAARAGDLQLQSAMLVNSAFIARDRGDNQLARQRLERSLELDRAAGVTGASGTTWNTLATVAMREGRVDEAETHLVAAIDSFRMIGDRRFEAAALNNLGAVRRKQGRWDDARDLRRASLEIRESIGDLRGKASSLSAIAADDLAAGRLARARRGATEARELARETSAAFTEAMATVVLGEVALLRGDTAQAREHFREARRLLERIEDHPEVLARDLDEARVLAAEGDAGQAVALATTVVEDCREHDFRPQLVQALKVLGEVRTQAGDEEGAATAFGESLELARQTRDPSLQAEAAAGLATLLLDRGAVAEAEPLVAVAARHQPMAADSLRLQSRLAAAHGDAPRALELLGEAREAAGERWSADDEAAFDRLRADLAATGGT